MCFSAEASFTSGVVISAIGIATLRKARKPEQRLFAVIPLLFAFQQFAEGVLWVTLRSSGYERLQNVATHIFLVTALIIWPVIVPLSVWFMEGVKTKKKTLVGLMLAGGMVSIFYAFCLFHYNVTPQINGFHLVYVNDFPGTLVGIAFLLYLASTIAPLFVSSLRRMRLFGILIATPCLITGVFYAEYLTSVWCFFAALISLTIYWVLVESRSEDSLLTAEIRLER